MDSEKEESVTGSSPCAVSTKATPTESDLESREGCRLAKGQQLVGTECVSPFDACWSVFLLPDKMKGIRTVILEVRYRETYYCIVLVFRSGNSKNDVEVTKIFQVDEG